MASKDRRRLTGVVTSNKMEKTVVVEVTNLSPPVVQESRSFTQPGNGS
jgi:ribosomal protein S17